MNYIKNYNTKFIIIKISKLIIEIIALKVLLTLLLVINIKKL